MQSAGLLRICLRRLGGMGWIETAGTHYVDAERVFPDVYDPTPQTNILVERSTELVATDPGGRLRGAVGLALDRYSFSAHVDLISYGWSRIELRELGLPPKIGAALRTSLDGLTDHTTGDLQQALAQCGHLDVPEFWILLCSSHADVPESLLHSDPDDGPTADPHWRDRPISAPHLSTPPVPDDGLLRRPGGRSDACFTIAAIGGEPPPRLRHLAEISGGVAQAVRSGAEAEDFAAAAHERYRAVLAAVDRRVREHQQWLDEKGLR